MNLIVACFEPTQELLRLRETVLRNCHELCRSFPSSYFKLLDSEAAWLPHVTLGKIRASRDEVGKASCRKLQQLALVRPAIPQGLTLLGERPKRAWCDWDEALAFCADETPGEEEARLGDALPPRRRQSSDGAAAASASAPSAGYASAGSESAPAASLGLYGIHGTPFC